MKLGPYEIRSQLGVGGMGEVYLAEDTELDRRVAVKILPQASASDQQRMQRFIQEAKAASGTWKRAASSMTVGCMKPETIRHSISSEATSALRI